MKIIINKDKLITVLSKADKLTGKNANLPILSCVKFSFLKDQLNLTSTNLDMGFIGSIKAKNESEIEFAVEGQLITQFLQNTPKHDDEVEFNFNENVLSLKTKSASIKIKTQSLDEFPNIPEINKKNNVSSPSNQLVEGLRSVWYSASNSNIKPELSSVSIYLDGEELVFVATDSYRLAEKRIKMSKIGDFEQILIPYKNVVEIIKLIEDLNENIEIYFDQDQIAIKTENIYIVTRIVNGSFPDYKQIIPKDFETKATVLKQDFVQQTKIANIFSDKFNQISLEVDTTSEKMVATSENQERGNSVNEIKAKTEGKPVKANFNSKYITDCFGSIDSDSLALEFNGSNKPLIIRGLRDSSFRYLVMPLNK